MNQSDFLWHGIDIDTQNVFIALNFGKIEHNATFDLWINDIKSSE